MRRVTFVLVVLGAVVAAWLWSRQRTAEPAHAVAGKVESRVPQPIAVPAIPPVDHTFSAADYPLAAELNQPEGTIRRDLEVMRQIFDTWRSNFPREGNPVGENNEITAALTGKNPLHLALIPKNHPAINANGELCDRWGTPFRFHQISGEQMEIRSAGPDRRFGTADDVIGMPVLQ